MPVLEVINSFIEDTCVLVAVAYLLTRGPFLTLLLRDKLRPGELGVLGLVLGLFGATEYIFPQLRYPYVTQTLFVTFAALTGGVWLGGLSGAIILLFAALHREPLPVLLALTCTVLVSCLTGAHLPRITQRNQFNPQVAFTAGLLTQATSSFLLWGTATVQHTTFPLLASLWSIPANGIGISLLGLVINDAQVRSNAERFRLEAEKTRAAAVDLQLAALRTRIHPHFLFNTLTSIAVLCRLAPEQAEQAVLHLSLLMRRALEADVKKTVSLAEELRSLHAYTDIESLRLGERLQVSVRLAPDVDCERLTLPAFTLLTLVENAVRHGIAPQTFAGLVTVTVRHSPYSHHVRIAVQDNGVGMPDAIRQNVLNRNKTDRPHGLVLLNQQICLLFGSRARLRLFSRENQGTLVMFQVPSG